MRSLSYLAGAGWEKSISQGIAVWDAWSHSNASATILPDLPARSHRRMPASPAWVRQSGPSETPRRRQTTLLEFLLMI